MTNLEMWLEIYDFPKYSVSNLGRVRSDQTSRVLTKLRNQSGVIHVGMVRDGVQYKRSLAKLVMHAFLPRHSSPRFDTPIHLDGDRGNCRATNLMWRPRAFADRFHRQFRRPRPFENRLVVDDSTGVVYQDCRHAAELLGLVDIDVLNSTQRGDAVWPTGQTFSFLD